MKEDQQIVFAYYYKEEFKGFRADTFNTISQLHPKIYTYSKEQVQTVIENIKQGCNKIGTAFAKILAGRVLVNADGNEVDGNALVEHLSHTEKTFREWGEFEIRVIPFVSGEEFYSLGEGEEWKIKQILDNLESAIEIHKFKVIDNEN